MEYQIIGLLAQAFGAVVSWFGDVIGNTGVYAIYISFVIVHLSIRYVFGPLMFSSGSDKAKKKKDGD